MAYILALDTTGNPGSIALADDERLLEEVTIPAPDGFSHLLFFEIANLLERHGLTPADIACFATAAGPGSFTGVRVGLTAAMGLAEATGRKVAPVSNLQAVAWFAQGDRRAVFLDARRGDVFGAIYDAQLRAVQEERVTKYDAWSAALPVGVEPVGQTEPLARAIAAIAWEMHVSGQTLDPADVEANYVRRSDAEMMWREL